MSINNPNAVPLSRKGGGGTSSQTLVELKTIEFFNLPTNNMLTSNSGYDIIVSNSGEIIYSPVEG